MARVPFADLNVTNPVLAAPMSGGPTTAAMVTAAASAGSLGFLAGGYKSPEDLGDEIRSVRSRSVPFGVNLFAPNPKPVDREEFDRYARLIQPEAGVYGLDLSESSPVENVDHWQEKVDLLLATPVPIAGFTFGIPERSVIHALRRVSTTLVQTVTSVDEALMAAEIGLDMLVVQSFEAGGHWGTLTPERPPRRIRLPELVEQIRMAVDLPLLAAGGIATSEDVTSVLHAGAVAALVGIALLRAEESGASDTYKTALAERSGRDTLLTRAFSGRPARAVPRAGTGLAHARAESTAKALNRLAESV